MAVSQNGWDLVSSDQLDKNPIPGTNVVPVPGVLAGGVATMLHWVGVQFNARVEALYSPGCWGWNTPTPIPGTNVYSNHCSGTAIDFNAPSFPWKTRTMSAAQRQACRDIVAATGGVVVWGGDFSTYVDEMHFEIDAPDAELAAAIRNLKGGEENMKPNDGDVHNAYLKFQNRKATDAEVKFYTDKTWNAPDGLYYGKIFPETKSLQDAVKKYSDAANFATGVAGIRGDRLNAVATQVGAKSGDDFKTITDNINALKAIPAGGALNKASVIKYITDNTK